MKNIRKLLVGATLLVMATATPASELLTVEVRARVIAVYDGSNVLGGQVTQGQVVTGSYTYDIHVPDQATSPGHGGYIQPNARMKLVVGPLVFETTEEEGSRHVDVMVGESLRIMSRSNKPLANGATVRQIDFDFFDSTGAEPATEALPTSAPNLRAFSDPRVFISGELNEQSYSIVMDIEYTYSVGVESELLISPGKSTFVFGQRFDVALMAPPGSEITRATSSMNGEPLPMSFPGTCHLAPPNSQNRPAIMCPDAHRLLPAREGRQRVDWAVELSNGRTIEHSVEWTLIP